MTVRTENSVFNLQYVFTKIHSILQVISLHSKTNKLNSLQIFSVHRVLHFGCVAGTSVNRVRVDKVFYSKLYTKQNSLKQNEYIPRFLHLSALSTDSSGKLNVFGHDGNSLGVNSTKIRVFKQSHEVCFGGFL